MGNSNNIKSSNILNVSLIDFAQHLGTNEDSFTEEIRELIDLIDFRYTEINGIDRDHLILSILKKIKKDKEQIAGNDRKNHPLDPIFFPPHRMQAPGQELSQLNLEEQLFFELVHGFHFGLPELIHY